MIYYRQNKDGSIIDFVEYTANEIIPSFILEQYEPTERTIIELAEGSFVFADTVDIAEVEAERRQKEFETARQTKLQEISEWTEHKITGGFISECTGEKVLYDTDRDTQSTMTRARANCEGQRFTKEFPNGLWVRGYRVLDDSVSDKKEVFMFSPAQIIKWDEDFAVFLASCKQAGWIKQAQVESANTLEDILRIETKINE